MADPVRKELDLFAAPLSDCSVIVEAGAGTGKTYALAALYLRLLVEEGLGVENILVVTFTEAATAELKTRIRQRILEALEAPRARRAAGPGRISGRADRARRPQAGRTQAAPGRPGSGPGLDLHNPRLLQAHAHPISPSNAGGPSVPTWSPKKAALPCRR